MATPEVSWRQGWDKQLLVLPVVGLLRFDLPSTNRGEFSGFSVHHLTPRYVLDCLGKEEKTLVRPSSLVMNGYVSTRRTRTSVNDALVCLMTTLLLLVMVAQIEMASPGT